MTLTQTDLSAIGSLIDQKITKAITENNKVLRKQITQDTAEAIAENNHTLRKLVAQDTAEALSENNKIIIDSRKIY